MEYFPNCPKETIENFSYSFHLFSSGETQKAYDLFIKTMASYENTLNSFSISASDIPYPDWFSEWRQAVLSKNHSQLSSLPSFPDFFPVIKTLVSVEETLNQIMRLYNDDKLGEAVDLLKKVREHEHKLFNDHENVMELESDFDEIMNVLKLVNDKVGWISECTGDISVKYKAVEGTKTYSMLTESILNVPLRNYITMLYEIDLYPNWLPFCTKAYCVANISRSRRVLVQEYNVRFTPKRHTCLYGFGANLLSSEGCVVIYAKSCDQKDHFKNIKLPKIDSTRAQVNIIACILRPITETQVSIQMLTNFDPNMYYVPYKILNFFTRKLAKGMFKKIAKLAINFTGSEYEKRINSEESREFYEHLARSEAEYLKKLSSSS